MLEKLKGYKTAIVFGAFLLNGILNLLGWGFELPAELAEKATIILSGLALVLRYFTKTPIFSK